MFLKVIIPTKQPVVVKNPNVWHMTIICYVQHEELEGRVG
jgi:hypothetical protein